MAKADGGNTSDAYPLRQRRSLEEKAKNEPDPDWRRFFMEVHYKRAAASSKKNRPVIACEYQKDGQTFSVVRERAEPEALKKFLKLELRNTGSKLAQDLEWLRAAWPKLVDAEVAEETDVFAFKNGVVTIVVYSKTLLQEIRQFHQDNILQDLRDIWQASIPLVSITYRIGVRKK